jgi:hypothetical protein
VSAAAIPVAARRTVVPVKTAVVATITGTAIVAETLELSTLTLTTVVDEAAVEMFVDLVTP